MKCPKCGFEQAAAEVCTRCGVEVRSHRLPAVAAVPVRPRTEPPPASRRAGVVLMAIGAADIAYMVYCVAQGHSYSSSFNIFALIAGVFLYRGSLAAARLVAHAAAFLLAGVAVTPLLVGIMPWDLVLISATLRPGFWAVGLLFAAAIAALLFWLRRELTTGAVADAFHAAGKDVPRTVLWMGAGIVVGLSAVLGVYIAGTGESARRAVQQAREQVGPDYRFFVTQMSVTHSREGTRGKAVVLAYRPTEIRTVSVVLGASEDSARDDSAGSAARAAAPLSAGAPFEPANEAAAYAQRARAHAKAGEYEQALAATDSAIELDPDRIGHYELADWILARNRQWDEIITRWTRFIEAHPDSGKAFYERGGAYHHKGDEEAARRDVEQACALQYDRACQLLERLGPAR
jgi:tetratricopeptide (TPR) repeat protein